MKNLLTGLILSFLVSTVSEAATYYVATTGSDSNSGTQSSPFRTIGKAANIVNPGDTVLVGDGVYSGGISLSRGGNSSAWITFKSQNRWGAKIQGGLDGIKISTQYVRVESFDISGQYSDVGAAAIGVASSNVQVVGNHLHDVGRVCTDITYGLDGIYMENVSNVTIDGNIINNIGRLAPGESGCNPSTGYYQNHDHGIYFNGGSNVVIKNNHFYNNKRGWSVHAYPNPVSGLKVLNNTFAFPNPDRDGHVLIGGSLSNSQFTNNVFYQPTTAAIDYCCGYSLSNVLANNNMIYGGVISASSPGGITFSNNFNNTDPKMVNPSGFDFHLQSTSPAIDKGATITEVSTDFGAVARPQGSSYDIGAYEYLSGTPLPAPSNLAVNP